MAEWTLESETMGEGDVGSMERGKNMMGEGWNRGGRGSQICEGNSVRLGPRGRVAYSFTEFLFNFTSTSEIFSSLYLFLT